MAPAPSNGHNLSSSSHRRRGLRYSLEVPLDVTILRWGIPDTVPGRSVNFGPYGLAAILAGELSPGDKVGIEMRLPELAKPLRTRALVRHQDKLRCGMEFVGLSEDQKASLRAWAVKAKLKPERKGAAKAAVAGRRSGGGGEEEPPLLGRRGWLFLLLSVVVLLAVLWWKWDRGWEDLEDGLRRDGGPRVEAQVPAEVMEKLVRHRVDPEYPAAARPQNLQGVIPLDVVVGQDGSVTSVRALGGPEVLARAAVEALRWWRFEPYRINGRAVVAETTVAVEFKP